MQPKYLPLNHQPYGETNVHRDSKPYTPEASSYCRGSTFM